MQSQYTSVLIDDDGISAQKIKFGTGTPTQRLEGTYFR